MFRASSRPSLGAQQLQQQPLVLPLERGGSSAVSRGRKGPDHDQQHRYYYSPTVKPEAVTAGWAPDDRREDARNMLSCTYEQMSTNKLEKLLYLVGWFIWNVWWCTDWQTLNFKTLNYNNCQSRWSRNCWDCGFEFSQWHMCLSLVSVVCCQVEVCTKSRSLVQRSPTEPVVCLSVIVKLR
jgi:hypothetical protein